MLEMQAECGGWWSASVLLEARNEPGVGSHVDLLAVHQSQQQHPHQQQKQEQEQQPSVTVKAAV